MLAESREASVSMTIFVEPDSLEITADRALIEQILINLIKNAIEAADGTTVPEIRLGAHLTAVVGSYCRSRSRARHPSRTAGPNFHPPFHYQEKRLRNWVGYLPGDRPAA